MSHSDIATITAREPYMSDIAVTEDMNDRSDKPSDMEKAHLISSEGGADPGEGVDDEISPLFQAVPDYDDAPPPVNTSRSLLETLLVRCRYYVPVIGWLPDYKKEYFMGDLIGGINVASIIIPQSLSYASLVGIPPIHGLYASFLPVLIYSLLGTSRQLSVGPEAVTCLLSGYIVESIASESEEERIVLIAVLTFMVGVIALLLGLFRFGFMDSILSRALLRGFILGSAVVIIVEQLPNLLGMDGAAHDASTFAKIIYTVEHIANANPATAGISVVSITALLLLQYVKQKFSHIPGIKHIPTIILVVIVVTIFSWAFRFDESGVIILGSVQGGFITPVFPKINGTNFSELLTSAILICIIGFVECIVVGKTYAAKHNYGVSANRELVALGVMQIFGSVIGAFPAFGSMPRSVVNNAAGAKTQLSGFITSMFVLLTILFLLPAFYYLPKAVLASIIFYAAIRLIELEDVIFIIRIRAWWDALLMLITFGVTLGVSIEMGTLVSVGLSIILVVKQAAFPRFTILGRTEENAKKFKNIDEYPEARFVEGILVLKIEEPLFFANTGQIKDRLRRVEVYGNMSTHPSEAPTVNSVRAVVFNIKNMPYLDASAMQILLEIVEDYHHRSIEVCFVKMRDTSKELFQRSGLIDLIGVDHFFRKTSDAIEFLHSRSRSHSTYATI